MILSKRTRRNLLESLELDDPCYTETRRLLQNLYRQQKGGPMDARAYLVTSAVRGEGKSTICGLMAIVSARIFHKRTLIVDGDLHHPTVHSLLGIPRGPGLFEVIRGRATSRDATQSTWLPLLHAMPSGYPRESIGEWYDDGAFHRLLQELRPNYDVVFVDAPPTVPAVEPILMAEHVDALVLVAMAGRTPLALARRTMQILAPVTEKIAGVILNNAADGLPYFFNYRYYGYEQAKPPRVRRIDKLRPPEQPTSKHAKNAGSGS